MHTEAEAKEKWCPMMKPDDDPISVTCVGSDCMAWRPSFLKMVDEQMVPTGYCGLAGEPKRHGP